MGRAHGGMGSEYLGAYGPMPPPGTAPYTGRAGSYSGQQYSSLASRHSHPSVAHYSYSNMNDHSYDQYTQAPQYLLPAQDPQSSMSSAYGAQDMSRQWTPMASNRHSMSGLDDPSFKYGTSGFPYLNSSAVASVGPDGFGMNSLNRALPRGDRILPNPRRSSVETSSNSHQKSGESASYGLPPGLGHRSSVAWSPQTLTNAASRGSTSSTSLSALSGSLSNVSSSPPVESNQGTTTFGYVPLSSSPLHQSITVPHAPTHDTMNKTAEKGSSLRDMAYPKTRTILPMRSSSSLYSWDTGAASKTGSTADPQDSDHTLVNGKQYTRIRQQPIKHNPGDPLPVEKAPSMVSTHNVATVTTQSRQR
ncbi:MAG: hypothetical protein L6R39_004872 [Caloplaca ligustica]|nr:MAG: hypothetical protein L6R39_004872 [Caloplaca ligustica]